MSVLHERFPAWSVHAMDAVLARLGAPENKALLDEVVAEYEDKPLVLREGRPRIEDAYPCLAVELLQDDDPWFSGDYTRDVKIDLNLIACVKVAGGAHPSSAVRERYIGRLAAVAKGILNYGPNLKYLKFTPRGDSIYDSGCGPVAYGHMHNSAVRAAQWPWFGKLIWHMSGPPRPVQP